MAYIQARTDGSIAQVVYQSIYTDESFVEVTLPDGYNNYQPSEWTYLNGAFVLLEDAGKVSVEEIRIQRDKLLAESDWTQSRDVVLSNDTEWATYRQALRDMPEGYVPTADPVWPTL